MGMQCTAAVQQTLVMGWRHQRGSLRPWLLAEGPSFHGVCQTLPSGFVLQSVPWMAIPARCLKRMWRCCMFLPRLRMGSGHAETFGTMWWRAAGGMQPVVGTDG